MALRSGTLTRDALLFFAVLIPSVILHEISHGVVALAFGDPTARDAGRLSLNPVRHVDPFGTVILPALMVMSTGAAFGYAKPVPVRPSRLRNPRAHSLLVSLAGPATNIALALVATVALRIVLSGDQLPSRLVFDVLIAFGLANVVLAVFNLIPLPPLDGSAVLERFLPTRWLGPWFQFRRYSMLVLLGLFLFEPSFFGRLINPAVDIWLETVF